MRDSAVFTDRRIITINAIGFRGRKKTYTSLPYAHIASYAIETAGSFDQDAALDIHFTVHGKMRFMFKGAADVVSITKSISEHVL